jgi:hypothetical protein
MKNVNFILVVMGLMALTLISPNPTQLPHNPKTFPLLPKAPQGAHPPNQLSFNSSPTSFLVFFLIINLAIFASFFLQ